MNLESIRECLDTETLRKLKKSFFANVPLSYKENIVKEVVPKIGVELKGEKELYYVKVCFFCYISRQLAKFILSQIFKVYSEYIKPLSFVPCSCIVVRL